MLKMQLVTKRIWNVFFRGRFVEDGEAMFEEHNTRVKALIPPSQLLVFEVQHGWGPLCEFLGVPVPVCTLQHCSSRLADVSYRTSLSHMRTRASRWPNASTRFSARYLPRSS
jgi:hypothetical protein